MYQSAMSAKRVQYPSICSPKTSRANSDSDVAEGFTTSRKRIIMAYGLFVHLGLGDRYPPRCFAKHDALQAAAAAEQAACKHLGVS